MNLCDVDQHTGEARPSRPPIRILRPAAPADLISAQVFDDAFARNLFPELDVQSVNLKSWLDSIFGVGDLRPDDPYVHQAFLSATRSFDFLCPNYQGAPFIPLLLYIRNRIDSRIRLLLIAHAPGACMLDWSLLRALVRPGDLVITPTRSARAVIDFVCPELSPYIRVIPHPMRPLPCPRRHRPSHIASLTRMHSSKLLHRQIEAVAMLRGRGFRDLNMRIATPLSRPGSTDLMPYARSLVAKIERLHLVDCVELTGPITGVHRKARFLSEARVLVNLSVTIEESFGKSIVEALGCGVPVLATRWNGFPETVGAAGVLVPPSFTPLGADVSADRIADGLRALLDGPPSRDVCRRQAAQFHPRRVRRLYREKLEAAMEDQSTARHDGASGLDGPGAPESGLLSITAPLSRFSWRDLFNLQLQDAMRFRSALAGYAHPVRLEADELRDLLIAGVRASLERLLSGVELPNIEEPFDSPAEEGTGNEDFIGRISAAAQSRATISSRLACLDFLARAGRVDALRSGLKTIDANRTFHWNLEYLETEALRLRGDYQGAFQRSIGQEEIFWSEQAAHHLRQLADICREWQLPGFVLPWLREWLERFPDSPESGRVWLDRTVNALLLSPGLLDEARQALNSARALLGESVDLSELAASVRETAETYAQAEQVQSARLEDRP